MNRVIPALSLSLSLSVSCGGATQQSTQHTTTVASTPAPRCGDAMGAWSPTVNGLRARLVTSGSRADHASLRVVLELQNVDTQTPLELHWQGYAHVGFANFRLDDATGHEVPLPPYALGGNEPGGALFEWLPAGNTRSIEVASNVFGSMNGTRILRIGAFWSREMPSTGEPRFLRAQLIGTTPNESDVLIDRANGPANTGARLVRESDPRGRAWIGTLDVPGVCVD